MKPMLNQIHARLWVPVKNWINKIVKGRNDEDDNSYNNPYLIF